MNALQVFTYTDHPVRVIKVNGDPFFVGKDVAAILHKSWEIGAINHSPMSENS